MPWTNDPVADYNRYCAEQERELEKYPVCGDCGATITDEYCYRFGHKIICENCLEDNYRVSTDILIDE